MTNKQYIEAIQARINEANTSVNLVVDGVLGPITLRALYRYLGCNEFQAADTQPLTVMEDERSQGHIAKLLPALQPIFTAWLRRVKLYAKNEFQVDVKIISSLRTFAEQDALYAKGRTKPGNKVTNARAGYSWHNFGVAIDLGIFRGKDYLDDNKSTNDRVIVRNIQKYASRLGKRDYNLEWGGDWKSFKDFPHYHYKTGLTLAKARDFVKRNKPIV